MDGWYWTKVRGLPWELYLEAEPAGLARIERERAGLIAGVAAAGDEIGAYLLGLLV